MSFVQRVIANLLQMVLFAILMTQGTGCEKSGGAKLIPVTGKVLLGDQPLTRGSISFRVQDAEPGGASPEPYGTIEADGTYKMYTNQKLGAPAGRYFALVVCTEDIDPKNASATPKSLIDRKYADIHSRLLPIEVVEQSVPGQYDIVLKK